MIVEVRKNVYVNPDHVVSVWFDVAKGLLVVQCVSNYHSFALVEGEMVETALARVAELLNNAGNITVEVKNRRTRKPVINDPQPLTK